MNAVFNAQSFIKESTLSLHVENTHQYEYNSYFLEGLNFLSQMRKEKTVQEAKLYRVMAEAGDNLWVVHEGFGDFFQWVKDFIKKVINFFKKLLAKFWVRINSLFGRDKYIENNKDQLREFGSEHEFDIKGYKFTIKDGIPTLDPVEKIEDALHGLAVAAEDNGKKSYKVKDKTALTNAYAKFQEDKDKLDNVRAAILGENGPIDDSDWKDALFEKFRDGDREKITITVTSSVVTESLTNFTNYDKMKSKTEKQRDNVEKAYNRIQKKFDELAEKAKNLAGDNVSVSDFVDDNASERADEDKIFTISAFARDISNRLEEISNLHVMAFTAKLDAIKDRYHQDKSIIYGAFKKILAKKSMWTTESSILESYQNLLDNPISIREVAEEIDTQNLEGITGPLATKMNNGGFLAGNDRGGKYQPTRQDRNIIPEVKDPCMFGGIPANLDPYMREKYYKSTCCCCEGNRLDLVEDLSYSTYMIECVIESEKLRGFANLLIGVHEGASVEKLEFIQEGVTDKLQNIWDKFKGFLNKVWEKFKNYMFRLVDNDTEYLERYKDIILNRKPNDFTFNMPNYKEGLKRMQTVMIKPFAAEKNTVTADEANTHAYKKSLIPGYNADDDWNKYCATYFEGGEDSIQYNLQDMNMTELYNYCHDWKSSILPSITRDQTTLQNNVNEIEKEINSLKTATNANTASTNTTNNNNANTNTTNNTNVNNTTTQNASASMLGPDLRAYGEMVVDNFANRVFNEAITAAGSNGSGSSSSGDSATQTRPSGAVTKGNSSATGSSSGKVKSISSMTGEKDQQTHLGNSTTGKIDKDDKGQIKTGADTGHTSAQVDELSKKLTGYNLACSGILTGKFTAAQNMYKDYMTLIKRHVGEQVGNKGDDRAAAGDNTGNANVIEDIVGNYGTEIDTINKTTSQEEKSKLVIALMDKIRAANPNYKGDFDAVNAAYTAATKNNATS